MATVHMHGTPEQISTARALIDDALEHARLMQVGWWLGNNTTGM
jgi:hypothetical protein